MVVHRFRPHFQKLGFGNYLAPNVKLRKSCAFKFRKAGQHNYKINSYKLYQMNLFCGIDDQRLL